MDSYSNKKIKLKKKEKGNKKKSPGQEKPRQGTPPELCKMLLVQLAVNLLHNTCVHIQNEEVHSSK